jgi:hypothetical protein
MEGGYPAALPPSLPSHQGLRKKICLRVPHYVALGHILQTTDLIATVPYSLAIPSLSPFKLAFCEHPLELPTLAVDQFWYKWPSRPREPMAPNAPSPSIAFPVRASNSRVSAE